MISISHAYILKKIWEIKTNNKSYLKYLSKSWTSYLFLKNNFKIFLHEEGIVGYISLVKFKEKNWKLWLKHLNRYNLSPKVWNEITPEQWRFKVSQHWKIKRELVITKNENNNFLTHWQNYIFKTTNSLMKIEKRNKLFLNNFLIYNYFDLTKNTLTKKNSKSKEQQDLNSNKIFIISDKKKKLDFSIIEKNIFFEYNLLLWFIPEFIKQRDIIYKKYTKKLFNLDTSIKLKNTILRNKELLQEGEFNQSIRQWRWKSKKSEKQFRKLGEMASLMTFMQNQDTKISLSEKMREDLDLFRLFFRRNNIVNQLTINSEHRLPRILDDQILIYKLINTSSNFRKRFEKILNLPPFNKYLLTPNVYTNYKLKNSLFNILSLEDILLPKNRREFRILNSLYFQTEKKNINSTKNFLNKIRQQPNKIKMNQRIKIKRFIWSSYRFEDLACMNRFWFSILNGSRFSMLRIRIYPIV
uniref:Ycf1 n=1 Tax=Lejeunea sp. 17-8794 TaxID=2846780 RepID=A0A8F3BC78_9MARC|nr:Ycf1 [Lejeunea sp. 17-8794]